MPKLHNTFNQLVELVKQNKAISITALLLITFLPFSFIYHPTTGSPYTTINILRFIVIAMFFVAVSFRQYPIGTVFKWATFVAVPAVALYITLLLRCRPLRADVFAMENRAIEELSFLLLMIAALAMIVAAVYMFKSKSKLGAGLAVIAGVVFFVIGMEEVSWLQFYLKLVPGDFFTQNNYQKEINFHNMNTELSERLYYFGAFAVLTLLPILHSTLSRLSDYLRQPKFKLLLPPPWLVAPFVISAAFMHTFNFYSPTYAVISIGSLCILSSLILAAYKERQYIMSIYLTLIGILFIYLNNYFITTDFRRLDVRQWVGTEYREFFIAWGLSVYGLAVLVKSIRLRRQI